MRRIGLAVVAALNLVLAPLAVEAQPPIRIGASLPLTGPYAAPAQNQLRGYRLCVKHANEKGGVLGRRIELIVEDDQSKPSAAVAIYERLITQDKVHAILGPYYAPIIDAGKRREVPMRQAVYDVPAALPGPREGRVWPAGDVRTAFENAVVDAQLDDFHFHDLRHHFASWYIMRGGSLPALQQILGHADINRTR